MSKLLDLPEGTYRVTKTGVKDQNAFRIVEQGQTVVGEYQPTIVVGETFMAVGRGFSDYIRTSVVKDFKLLKQGKVEIETANSYYLLEEITGQKNILT